MTKGRFPYIAAAAMLAFGWIGCSAAGEDRAYGTALSSRSSPSMLRELGRKIFSDPSLSSSGKLACASCHHPEHAYGPPNDLATQMGGKDMAMQGMRAAPSLRYLQSVPPFSEHFFDDDGDDSIDQGPAGGHDWDGRADSAHEQAGGPLLAPNEMGNAGPNEVAEKLRRATYSADFERAFGKDVFADPARAFRAATMALEVFQETYEEFFPYTSKYDAFLRGDAQLTAQEQRGLALFRNPEKGNCLSCHPADRKIDGSFPQFTDYGFVALGAPRNPALQANRDSAYFDLGLCGPVRRDLSGEPSYCGRFRTPSLRNVALRRAFFHNGVFHDLKQVLRFYARRDTHPDEWYSKDAVGQVRMFDDLPAEFSQNIYRERPFGQRLGGSPALTDAEIEDVIAFLKTLTDGYR